MVRDRVGGSNVSIRAVLFDVGGPIDTEVTMEGLVDEAIRAELEAQGIFVSDAEYEAANTWAVDSFAPRTYEAIVWKLADGREDVARRVTDRFRARARQRVGERAPGDDLFEERPSIRDLLGDLQSRGLQLGIVANQGAATLPKLEAHGLAHFFQHMGMSGLTGLTKPDVRVFVGAADALGMQPEECVVVGDRVDNDIFPAKSVGMRAVLFRTGRHRNQMPRSHMEVPDATVETVDELAEALDALI